MEQSLTKAIHKCIICATDAAVRPGYIYAFFRILVGLLFFQHGLQKVFGLLGGVNGQGGTVELMSLYGAAGLIELVGGLAVALGIGTRLFALIATVEMAVAYGMAHLPQSFFPVLNKGELALFYFISFLLITMYGAGKLSVEKALFGKEAF